MGVPASEVGYAPAMPRREDHEVHKGHVVALEKKKIHYSHSIHSFFRSSEILTAVWLRNAFIGCDTVLLGEQLQTSWTSRHLMVKEIPFSETSGAALGVTQRRFLEQITHTYCYM